MMNAAGVFAVGNLLYATLSSAGAAGSVLLVATALRGARVDIAEGELSKIT